MVLLEPPESWGDRKDFVTTGTTTWGTRSPRGFCPGTLIGECMEETPGDFMLGDFSLGSLAAATLLNFVGDTMSIYLFSNLILI